MKRLFIIFCLLVIFVFGYVKDDIGVSYYNQFDNFKNKVAIEQENLKTDKYKQIEKTTDKETNIIYQVIEYVSPNGIGHQDLFYDETGRVIESIGYGPEAKKRTWVYVPPIITPTST